MAFASKRSCRHVSRLCQAQAGGLTTLGLSDSLHLSSACIAAKRVEVTVHPGGVPSLQAAAPQALFAPAGKAGCSSNSAWHKGLRSRSLPVSKHKGKGGDDQRHNQSPHSGGCVELPKGHDKGNIQPLHADALTCHSPPACLDGVQGQL